MNPKPNDADKRSSTSYRSHRSSQPSQYDRREPSYDDPPPPPSRLKRIVDSFREHEDLVVITGKRINANGIEQMELEDGLKNSAVTHSRLQRRLKSRHLQMIAIGGSIG